MNELKQNEVGKNEETMGEMCQKLSQGDDSAYQKVKVIGYNKEWYLGKSADEICLAMYFYKWAFNAGYDGIEELKQLSQKETVEDNSKQLELKKQLLKDESLKTSHFFIPATNYMWNK